MLSMLFSNILTVPGNIHAGVSGNSSIVASGVYTSQELLRITRCEYLHRISSYVKYKYIYIRELYAIAFTTKIMTNLSITAAKFI